MKPRVLLGFLGHGYAKPISRLRQLLVLVRKDEQELSLLRRRTGTLRAVQRCLLPRLRYDCSLRRGQEPVIIGEETRMSDYNRYQIDNLNTGRLHREENLDILRGDCLDNTRWERFLQMIHFDFPPCCRKRCELSDWYHCQHCLRFPVIGDKPE